MTILTLNICQIVGFKNSGKTTLMSALLKALEDQGRTVGSIKHHAHQESDPLNGGDSGDHFQSGAKVSGLVSPAFAHLTYKTEPPLEAFIAFYKTLSELDWLFIEGYKEADFPKLVLVQSEADYQALASLSNILAIVSDHHQISERVMDHYPFYLRDDLSNLVALILDLESGWNET